LFHHIILRMFRLGDIDLNSEGNNREKSTWALRTTLLSYRSSFTTSCQLPVRSILVHGSGRHMRFLEIFASKRTIVSWLVLEEIDHPRSESYALRRNANSPEAGHAVFMLS
jgi:hypothetical protein